MVNPIVQPDFLIEIAVIQGKRGHVRAAVDQDVRPGGGVPGVLVFPFGAGEEGGAVRPDEFGFGQMGAKPCVQDDKDDIAIGRAAGVVGDRVLRRKMGGVVNDDAFLLRSDRISGKTWALHKAGCC